MEPNPAAQAQALVLFLTGSVPAVVVGLAWLTRLRFRCRMEFISYGGILAVIDGTLSPARAVTGYLASLELLAARATWPAIVLAATSPGPDIPGLTRPAADHGRSIPAGPRRCPFLSDLGHARHNPIAAIVPFVGPLSPGPSLSRQAQSRLSMPASAEERADNNAGNAHGPGFEAEPGGQVLSHLLDHVTGRQTECRPDQLVHLLATIPSLRSHIPRCY